MAPDNRFRAAILASLFGFILLLAGTAGSLLGSGGYGPGVMSLLLAATMGAAAWRIWEDRQ